MTSPSDLVREAAKKDSRTAVETWGPEAFARRIRTKIHGFGAPLPPWEDKTVRPTPSAKGIPKSVNIILLGPTGSGKSSLVYTWWRALSGSVTAKEEFLAANMHDSRDTAAGEHDRERSFDVAEVRHNGALVDEGREIDAGRDGDGYEGGGRDASDEENKVARQSHSVLQRLKVGWNARDGAECRRRTHGSSEARAAGDSAEAGRRPGSSREHAGDRGAGGGQLLSAAPKHGTTALQAFQLQAPDPLRGSGGITVHDTKGQQFFTEEEERFAEQMLQGKLKEGSTLDKQNFKYWFMIGNFGFLSTASLAAAPHVVVLVFDVTLRGFEQMLRERETNELCQCYRKLVRRAGKQGHEVFAVLTHIDQYAPDDDSDDDDDDDDNDDDNDNNEAGDKRDHPPEQNAGERTVVGGTGFDREADMPGIISLWRERVSKALSGEGMAVVPPHNVFALQNYHKGSSAQDPVVDLASLECLESVIEAGARYVDMRYHQQQEVCTIA